MKFGIPLDPSERSSWPSLVADRSNRINLVAKVGLMEVDSMKVLKCFIEVLKCSMEVALMHQVLHPYKRMFDLELIIEFELRLEIMELIFNF